MKKRNGWISMMLFMAACCALPMLASLYSTAQKTSSVLMMDSDGFSDRSKAERQTLKDLLRMLKEHPETNMLWSRYILSVRLHNGKTGNRLALVGYNRETMTLLHRGSDPDLNTNDSLPEKEEGFSPVMPEDIEALVKVGGVVNDIRKIKPEVKYQVRILPLAPRP